VLAHDLQGQGQDHHQESSQQQHAHSEPDIRAAQAYVTVLGQSNPAHGAEAGYCSYWVRVIVAETLAWEKQEIDAGNDPPTSGLARC
jgi:hypothetical protein